MAERRERTVDDLEAPVAKPPSHELGRLRVAARAHEAIPDGDQLLDVRDCRRPLILARSSCSKAESTGAMLDAMSHPVNSLANAV